MSKEADRDKSIMNQILKLHKKIDYLTDQVMDRLDKIQSKEESDENFSYEPQGIQSITIQKKK